MLADMYGKGCRCVKAVVLADIHSRLEPLERMKKPLSEADVVVLAGDITNFGGTDQIRAVIETIQRYAGRVLAVAGNCDTPLVDAYLTEAGINLHGAAVCVEGWWFVGAGGALPDLGHLPNKAGERLFTEALEQGLGRCGDPGRLVVVTHQPAWNTALDAVGPGRHSGNRAIRAFIDRACPRLAVSGHIHDLIGTDHVGPTTLVNPGPAKDGRYADIELHDEDVRVFLQLLG